MKAFFTSNYKQLVNRSVYNSCDAPTLITSTLKAGKNRNKWGEKNGWRVRAAKLKLTGNWKSYNSGRPFSMVEIVYRKFRKGRIKTVLEGKKFTNGCSLQNTAFVQRLQKKKSKQKKAARIKWKSSKGVVVKTHKLKTQVAEERARYTHSCLPHSETWNRNMEQLL